jgi:hypothetical protein
MTTAVICNLEEAIVDAGEGGAFHQYGFATAEESRGDLGRRLDSVQELARQRLGDKAPELSEDALLKESPVNPGRLEEFSPVLAGTKSTRMLPTAWRIRQGLKIKSPDSNDRRQRDCQLRVVLGASDEGPDEPSESSNVQDFSLLRQFGIMELNGRPVLDGFDALHLSDETAIAP